MQAIINIQCMKNTFVQLVSFRVLAVNKMFSIVYTQYKQLSAYYMFVYIYFIDKWEEIALFGYFYGCWFYWLRICS